MGALLNPFVFAGGGAASQVYRGYVKVKSSTSPTITLSNVPIGPASADRVVVLAISSTTATSERALNSVTIGGVPAAIHVQRRGITQPSIYGGAVIASAPLSVGVTANVVLAFTGGSSFYTASVGAFSATGLSGAAPATASSLISVQPSISAGIDVQQGGVLFASLTAYDYNYVGIVAQGITNRFDARGGAPEAVALVGASSDIAATQFSRSVIFSQTGGSAFNGVLAVAAFR